ncbi:MAG: acyl-CoA dehydrogenase family protein, partial [Dehalococcoidales bacterium]|nr:acyl-CoA dehydrogenase family protein [Dehalococcoidales bacterium]
MDFEIPEELKMVRSLVRDFVNDQLKPLERGILGRAADLRDARMFLPEEAEEKLAKMARDVGLWGIGIPEELGGVGLSTLGNCLVEEELAQTVTPFNFGDVTPILFECNAEQREKYFFPVLHRQKHAYLALIEPEIPLPDIKMRAEKVNGYYVLNGRKVSFSRPHEDYFAVVFAAMDDRATCFLVDKDTPGFTVSGDEEKMGWQAQLGEPMLLVFDQCQVPAEHLLGEQG